jgi:formylmethanofuran dehydrogenase subunit E
MRSDLVSVQDSLVDTEVPSGRVKIHIRCRKCGEVFILRGIRDMRGHVETGFRRCLCDNDRDFDIETLA